MIVTLETATPADAEPLVTIEIAAFHHDSVLYPDVEPGGPPGYNSIEHCLKLIKTDIYYKIMANDQIVGGIVAFDHDEGHLHLDLIFIDPAFHDLGIGTQAMTLLEAAHPTSKWTLDTPQYAIRNQHFYEKLGYVKVREYLDDGFPLIAYEKRIT